MRLIVTRPENDSTELVAALKATAQDVMQIPLLEIEFFEDVAIVTDNLQAVLITSANGARGLAKNTALAELTGLKVVCVGPASRAAAQKAGFRDVATAEPGDVSGVVEFVISNLDPNAGDLLYASGEKTSGDLVGQLTAKGFGVRRTVLYKAKRARQLPLIAEQQIETGQVDGVLLYSPRTAKIWLSVTQGVISPARLSELHYYCLSANVAAVLYKSLGNSADVTICETPDNNAMIAAISHQQAGTAQNRGL